MGIKPCRGDTIMKKVLVFIAAFMFLVSSLAYAAGGKSHGSKGQGSNVLRAGSGPQAIEAFKGNKDTIDIVILDLLMPEMGGGETFDRLRVKKGAFDFRGIYAEARKATVEQRKNAEGPHAAVSFFTAGKSSAREYCLPHGRPLLAGLLLIARDNTLPPLSEIEQRSYDKINSFWKHNPFVSQNQAHALVSSRLRLKEGSRFPPDSKNQRN